MWGTVAVAFEDGTHELATLYLGMDKHLKQAAFGAPVFQIELSQRARGRAG